MPLKLTSYMEYMQKEHHIEKLSMFNTKTTYYNFSLVVLYVKHLPFLSKLLSKPPQHITSTYTTDSLLFEVDSFKALTLFQADCSVRKPK